MDKEKVRIKICGLRRREDILAVNRYLPDYAGFILGFPRSFRCISEDELADLTGMLDSRICPVGVFVNADPEWIESLLKKGFIRIAQLHGAEDEEYINRIKNNTGCPVIKAFKIGSAEDVSEALKSSADYILLDQGYGSGKTFDWNLVPRISRPFFLAGGLSEDNIDEALKRLSPFAVDLSSSVETDRFKNPQKIERIIAAVREPERRQHCPKDDLETTEANTSPKH